MATQGNQIRESMVAGADLSTKQFTAVKMDAADSTVVSAGNGEAIMGVLLNDPASGMAATVVVHGRVLMEVGTGGLTAGDDVGVDADGKAVAAATGDVVIGKCVTGALVDEIASVDIFRGGNVAA